MRSASRHILTSDKAHPAASPPLRVPLTGPPPSRQKGKTASPPPPEEVPPPKRVAPKKRANATARSPASLPDLPEALFAQSPAPAFIHRGKTILAINPAFGQLYGYESSEIVGHPLHALFSKAGTTLNWAPYSTASVLETERHRHKNGRELSVKLSSQPVQWEGEAAELVQIIDCSEMRELEARFLRVQRLECLGTLASGVAHDLNNVLSPILMAASMLQDDLSPETRQEFITAIEQSAQRGARLLRQVLAFVRGVEGEKSVIQPGNLIREVLTIIRQTFPRTLRIHGKISDDLWELSGEGTKLYQVFLNLAVNARDAMEGRGDLTIDVYNCELDTAFLQRNPEARPGRYVAFTFRDTGSGMSDEVSKQIFVPFFSTKDTEHGTGLGLPTVLGIVKGHGGCIEVQSEEGRGSVFSVFFPALESGVALEDAHGSTGKTILVIDDDATIRRFLKTILTRHGYRVICASNGTEGVSAYVTKSSSIDLVIADLMMPSMDGVVFSRAIKRLNNHAEIIVSSGAKNASRMGQIKALGITRFLHKPYTSSDLLEIVRTTLAQSDRASDEV